MAAPQPEGERLLRVATRASLSVATTLALVKLAGWWITGSVGVLGAMVDSLMDVAASLVTFVGVRQALVPADDNHRFGHGKAEPLAALVQSAFIGGTAVVVAAQAVPRLVDPPALRHPLAGMVVMGFSVLATLALVAYQRRVVARTGSLAVRADSMHYVGDVLSNLAVGVGVALASWPSLRFVDPLLGLGIAGWLLWTAYSVARESIDMLMDRELPEGQRDAIVAAIRGHEAVLDLQTLRTRASGPQVFVEAWVEVDGGLDLRAAERLRRTLGDRVRAVEPHAEVTVHARPDRNEV